MAKLKTVATHITDIVDLDTGELVDRSIINKQIVITGPETFFTVYSNHFRCVLGLEWSECKVLLWSSMNSNLDTGEIALNKLTKERMAEYAFLSMSSISNAITKLVKLNMLVRLGHSVYKLNPETTWKGHLNMRAKNIGVYLNYTNPQPTEA